MESTPFMHHEDLENDEESMDSFSSLCGNNITLASGRVHDSRQSAHLSSIHFQEEEQMEDFEDSEDDFQEEQEIQKPKKSNSYYILPSKFVNRPGTVAFSLLKSRQEMENQFQAHLQEAKVKDSKQKDEGLYYCMPPSAVEFNAIKNAFKKAGFKKTKSISKCNFLWGKHMKFDKYAALNEFQRYNHFPGTWALGRKDNLHKHLTAMRRKFPSEYNFFPQSYLLPEDRVLLETDMLKHPGSLYIMKPRASSCGRGIKVINSLDSIKRKDCLIQKYISDPYLINGKKWDLRLYVVVTSFDPLVVYLFDDGLTRFATETYDKKKTGNRYAHLTNYSINKKSKRFEKNVEGASEMTGSKWSIKALKRYFKQEKIDDRKLWISVNKLVIKTLIAVESHVNSLTKRYLNTKGFPCYEIFGFDVLVDSKLKPWIVEVNVSPSLSSSSPLDKEIKSRLMTEMFHMIGCIPYKRKEYREKSERNKQNRLFGYQSTSDPTSRTKTPHKRTLFDLQRIQSLNFATEDEKNILMHFEDEYSRRGGFDRIFPSNDNYFKFSHLFENERYNNLLLTLYHQNTSIRQRLLPFAANSVRPK